MSWLRLFHGMGMTVSTLFGAESTKITPLVLGDILLWPRVIDKYRAE